MNAVIVSCKKCLVGQVPLIPDEDGECQCVQCGERHDLEGNLLISKGERARVQRLVEGNGDYESTQYHIKRMYKKLGEGDLVYGNGCSRHADCETCPFDDCEATYRYPRMGAKKPFFVLSNSYVGKG